MRLDSAFLSLLLTLELSFDACRKLLIHAELVFLVSANYSHNIQRIGRVEPFLIIKSALKRAAALKFFLYPYSSCVLWG